MDALDSTTEGTPRLVVGGKVFTGFTKDYGEPQWLEALAGWMGYANQILLAVKDLEADQLPEGQDPSGALELLLKQSQHSPWRSAVYAFGIFFVFVILYFFILTFWEKKKQTDVSMVKILKGIGLFIVVAGLFVTVSFIPEGAVSNSLKGKPFALMVFVTALLDGFNPCAFTVLFILLSLLTYTKKRSMMLKIAGIFVISSGLIYIAFILIMVFFGSVSIGFLDYWILRIIGAVVIVMGIITMWEIFSKKYAVTSLSADQKSYFARSAGKIIKRLNNEESVIQRSLTYGSVVVLAFVVNSLELGCTAVLPAVYMSSLLMTYGAKLNILHIGWTFFYGVIYLIPMLFIVLNFVIHFRSARMDVKQGKTLKVVGGVFMISLGFVLLVNPEFLTFS